MLESRTMSQELSAHVENGRIVVDTPTDLPEGTKLRLLAVSEEDLLDIESADAALAEAGAKDEKPIPWSQAKSELGL
jgi:hypothetical protein